jgi:hypothetical protein
MNIPKVTEEKPYIEFRFDKNGNVKFTATSNWWGGKNSGFIASGGYEGNTCLPKDLDAYMKAFKDRKVKTLEKEIDVLQKKLKKLQSC